MATDPPSFGALLKRHRLAAGLTQEALAERAGVSPRLDSVALLAAALGLAPAAHQALLAAARPGAATPAAVTPAPVPDDQPRPARAPLPVPATPLIGCEDAAATALALLQGKGYAC